MEIETKVISIESIKPSSPTPKSLQKHHISFLDQSMPPLFLSFVYLYAPNNPKIPNSEKSKQLKKSLSEVLSRFYPLAGRRVDNLYVDCNDEGAPFIEAEADCDLSQAMPHANPKLLSKLIPYKVDELQDFCLAVQATYFRCGGLALGIIITHKLVDGISYNLFTTSWAAVARNGGMSQLPEFDTAAYFPPLQDTSVLDPTTLMTKEEVSNRIVTFPAAIISHLQDKYSGGGGKRPSRVQAVSAFIWTQFASATGAGSDPNKIYSVQHTIDLRRRADPPMSNYHFGNVVGLSSAVPAAGDGGVEVVQKIREAVKAVNSGYVAPMNNSETESEKQMLPLSFFFSSLCGFPLYEADFGWGKPFWVGLPLFPVKNLIFLLDTKSGDGIEAFIQFAKQDMEKFAARLDFGAAHAC